MAIMAGLAGCNSVPRVPIIIGDVSIKPDDYADGTVLTNIVAGVTLVTAGDDNQPFTLFDVTASDDGRGLAPSGERVFGHAGIPFFNNVRRLRMDFSQPVGLVSLTFGGGTYGESEIGRLQVYDSSDNLLQEYVTAPRGAGETEVMIITRAAADIHWAVAFIAENEGSFGRLDDLSFTGG